MSLVIHAQYASPHLYQNQIFLFGQRVYQVDKRILHAAKKIFQFLIQQVCHVGPLSFAILQTKRLTPPLLDRVLDFFQSGYLPSDESADVRKQLHQVGKGYGLSVLVHYLTTTENGAYKMEEEAILRELELGALRQDPKQFYLILMGLKQDEVELNQKEIKRAFLHFQPAVFETLMVEFIRPELFDECYALFLSFYVRKRAECLESELYFFKDSAFKFDCIIELSDVDKRLKWLRHYPYEMPIEKIRQCVIQPLIEQSRLKEAKEWILKVRDCEWAPTLFRSMVKNGQAAEAQELSILMCEEEINDIQLEHMVISLESSVGLFSPSLSAIQLIQKMVSYHIDKTKQDPNCQGMLIDTLRGQLKEELNVDLDASLLLLTIRSYIQATLAELYGDMHQDLRKQKIEIKPEEWYLHPSLQEDFSVLQVIFFYLEKVFSYEFRGKIVHRLLGQDSRLLTGMPLLEEILASAREIYGFKISHQKDFIVHFVSAYLQPYVMGQRAQPHLNSKRSLISELERSLQRAGLGSLSCTDIELALRIYIQKYVEGFYFRHFPKKTEPQNMVERQMLSILKTSIKYDFPLDQAFHQLAPQVRGSLLPRNIHAEILRKAQLVEVRRQFQYDPLNEAD